MAGIIVLDVLLAGALYARGTRHLGYQACVTLYVADVGAPSLISAPVTTLAAAGQLLAGETAANFFADDLLDVAQSQHVAAYVSARLRPRGLPNTAEGDINGAVTGSRRNRTDTICATNPNPRSAPAVASGIAFALTHRRALFVGRPMARRTYVGLVSDAATAPVAPGRERRDLLLRLILGLLVAGGLALVVDALDPRVTSARQAEAALAVPVLTV